MEEHYNRWAEEECIQSFNNKKIEEFFETETYFLQQIKSDIHAVLDIGCASGYFMNLLRKDIPEIDFTGLDIVPQSIENAKNKFPGGQFFLSNALEFNIDKTYNLVNATGVVQHEPQFKKLIQKMYALSNHYVLFDCKLAAIQENIVDINISYCGSVSNRMYYNIFNFSKLIDFLKTLPCLKTVKAFGYTTKLNDRTVVPEAAQPIVSAGVLLEKDSAGQIDKLDFFFDLPEIIQAGL